MKNLSLNSRMMIYSIIMVIIVVSILTSVLLYYHKKYIWEEFDQRKLSLASALSQDLELLVLLEDKSGIERMLEGTLKVKDVISITVFDKHGKILLQKRNPSSVQAEYRNIVASAIEIESEEINEEMILAKLNKTEHIGSVEIVLSALRLENDIIKMIYIVLIFTIIMVVFRIASDYYFTKGITKPIYKLVKGSETVANGDLALEIDIKRSDEIGKLASSFNTMIKSLKKKDGEISHHQQQIESKNRKLNKSLKEKEALLREIHHRVKNNMQIISSMLRLQSRYVKDKKDIEIFKDCINRIRSMANIHEKLYKTEDFAYIDFKLYIKEIAGDLFRSYIVNRNLISLNINVEDIFLGIDTAIPCGLIINELISNSLKHAFPVGKNGEIKTILRYSNGNKLELIVSDNGIGFPKDIDINETDTMGLGLVGTLTKQLRGKLEIDRSMGTTFRIEFEMPKNNKKV